MITSTFDALEASTRQCEVKLTNHPISKYFKWLLRHLMRRKPHNYSCRLSRSYWQNDDFEKTSEQKRQKESKNRNSKDTDESCVQAVTAPSWKFQHEESPATSFRDTNLLIEIYNTQCDCEMPYSKHQLLYSFFRRALKPNRNVPKTRSESRLVVSSQMLLLPERLRWMYSTTAAPCTRLPTP